MCSVLIADHPIVSKGLRHLLAAGRGFKLLAEVADGSDVLQQVATLKPDILLLEIGLPMLDGFSIAEKLQQLHPPTKVIFFTSYREEGHLQRALQVGAKGYLLKESTLKEIETAIRSVCNGLEYISPAMTSHLVRKSISGNQVRGIEHLTTKERIILKLIAQYKTTKEIAEATFVSPRTIEKHRNNIANKLHLRGSHAILKFAISHEEELATNE